MHVALYARVSTHQQHQEHTIDSQVHLLKHYIQQQGWTLLPDHAYLDRIGNCIFRIPELTVV